MLEPNHNVPIQRAPSSLNNKAHLATPIISVVVPVFNEEGNIPILVTRIKAVLDSVGDPWELVLVNDGSSDHTWEDIEREGALDQRVRGASLSRNFGHQHALLAGLSLARGNAIISMDGDMQHPPEILPQLIKAWKEGAKVVSTRRLYNHSVSKFKRLSSRYFYTFFTKLSEVPMEEGSSDFRLLDRQALDVMLHFGDASLFLRGTVNWIGFTTRVVEFEAGTRLHGKSKYNLVKMFQFAWSAILSFSTKPLRLGIWVGGITSVLAFFEVIYSIIRHLQGHTLPGWTSIIAIISFLFGILFMILGVIGLYLGSVHTMLQNRPRFIVATEVNPPHNNFPED